MPHSHRRMSLRPISCTAVYLALILPGSTSSAELILNEALANEPGSVTSSEWIEVLNWPDSGDGATNLQGYRYIDSGDSTDIDTSLLIEPGGFVILARQALGANSFESNWGDNSGVWGDHPSESYPVINVSMALRNSGDTAMLMSPTGHVSTISWTSNQADGVSWERKRPDRHDEPDNFAQCNDPTGSTPGRHNSALPARGDMQVDSVWIATSAPRWHEDIFISATVTNVGFGPVFGRLTFERALNPETVPSETEILTEVDVPTLAEGEAVRLNHNWLTAPPGINRIVARLHDDALDANNEQSAVAIVAHTVPLLIVSEYLANPESAAGPGEWVEISNQVGFPINMSGVRIGDDKGQTSTLGPFAGFMPPAAFWVLARDQTAFRAHYPPFDGLIIEVGNWQALNDDYDMIRLIGAAGEVVDSVPYTTLYPDNRSVERVNLGTHIAGLDDWTGSVDASGATPGRTNSVSRERAGRLAMMASPNPLSLQSGARMVIDYRLDVGESLTMKIFDRDGVPVRTLIDNHPAATGLFEWDGSDQSGRRVKPGPYVLWARSEPSGREQKMLIVIAP